MWKLGILFVCWGFHSVDACGITTHIDIAERTREFLGFSSEGIFYKDLIDKHPDAFQAGAPYPDAYYPDVCFGGDFHDVAEDTHWTPFLNASVNYIRKRYSRPWNEDAEKLVVFLMSVVQHQVADASWHSLGIDQGFLRAMANINYHGSFSAAHSDGDFGGDVVNLFALDTEYIGRLDKWYVPTQDLLGIYEELYGRADMMREDVIQNCTFLLFLGRLGENLGIVDLLYPQYAEASPFLIDQLQSYYLGGMDDMATWSSHVIGHTVTMLDHGTDVCELPENPLYIECNQIRDNRLRSKRSVHQLKNPGIDEEFLLKTSSLIDEDEVIVTRSARGVYFEPTESLKRKIMQSIKSAPKVDVDDAVLPDFSYSSSGEYSRFGEAVITGDVNNDGLDDLIIGAPDYGESGSVDGFPSVNSSIDEVADKKLIGIQENGRFGTALAIVDLNADGVNDLAISAPTIGSGSLQYHGVVYIFYGTQTELSDIPSVTYVCQERYCNFGSALASGDLNLDGFADLVVGSPHSPGNFVSAEQRGAISVLYADAERKGSTQILRGETSSQWMYFGSQDYDWTGFSLDVHTENSGQTWLAVGAPTHRICTHDDCRYDSTDLQSVGKVLLFKAPLSDEPQQVILGHQVFGQTGFSVKFGKYRDQAVLSIGSVTAVGEIGSINNLTQAGEVALFNVSANGLDLEPWLRFEGDRSFGRFGSNVLFMRLNNTDVIAVSAALRSETMLHDREAGKVFIFYPDSALRRNAFEADVVLSFDEDKSHFGTSLIHHEASVLRDRIGD
ncbi:hypothetical protein CAPTEDRAFT_196848 [Capitella teleta]|uniref:Phosphatidylinositol-glycan-specific phospholipase D n=1 Tax=Capitella teleta TaxID=283909 RepID=R7VLU7_CAPTE|nr:hypothetical protein CAPTEDRAFT_196848 [Capitella teleta]|eukprot:ELU17925.1 hypothetical protein CAPTEDRAFT_196848 [Capitella teleta]